MKNGFLIAMALSFTMGWYFHESMDSLCQLRGFRGALVFAVILATSLGMFASASQNHAAPAKDSDEPAGSVPLYQAVGLACVFSVFAVPAIAFLLVWFVPRDWLPPVAAAGLLVATFVPCTQASAAVWTARGGGRESVAMAVTLVTNFACLVTIPLSAWIWMGGRVSVGAAVAETAGNAGSGQQRLVALAITVGLPLVLAALVSKSQWGSWRGSGDFVRPFVQKHRRRLTQFAQSGILVMVAIGAAKARSFAFGADVAENSDAGGFTSSGGTLALVLTGLFAIAAHTGAFWSAILVTRWLKWDRATSLAVAIAGSQKTLMVGLQVAIDWGVPVIPMLVYHVGQLILDTRWVDRWRDRTESDRWRDRTESDRWRDRTESDLTRDGTEADQ